MPQISQFRVVDCVPLEAVQQFKIRRKGRWIRALNRKVSKRIIADSDCWTASLWLTLNDSSPPLFLHSPAAHLNLTQPPPHAMRTAGGGSCEERRWGICWLFSRGSMGWRGIWGGLLGE